jgi:hypothetical protein
VSSIARLHDAQSIVTHTVILTATAALKRKAQGHVDFAPCSLPGKPLPKRSDTLNIQRFVSRGLQNHYFGNLASLVDVESEQSSPLSPVATSF